MRPFGGTAVCPRCGNPVYAAEQVMGPGRKLYHKSCLVCTTCNKRLDSLLLLEHNQEPYCRSCHVKNFGTRDLRHANLSHRAGSVSIPSSPVKVPSSVTNTSKPSPILSSSPTPTTNIIHACERLTNTFDDRPSPSFKQDSVGEMTHLSQDQIDRESGVESSTGSSRNYMETGNGAEGRWHSYSHSLDTLAPLARFPASKPLDRFHSPLMSTSTGTPMGAGSAAGTRYGAVLTGQSTGGIAKTWGGTTPTCGKCGKNVYFAEQAKAAGKTYHKGCLRCAECNTLLDSTRLTEKDGKPLCRRCYGKLHGPQGSGYALLGKAGG